MENFTVEDFKSMFRTTAMIKVYESAIYHIGKALSNDKILTNQDKFEVIERIISSVKELDR